MHAWLSRVFGPVFARDLIELSRQKRTYLLRVTYGAFLLYGAYLAWERVGGGTRLTLAEMTRMTALLMEYVFFLQVLSVHIVVPMLLCNAVAGERKAGTLDLLFTTHLTDREIVVGKLAGRLVAMFMLVLSSVPVVSLFALFGGVSFGELAAMEVYCLGALLFAGGAAVAMSVKFDNPFVALLVSLAIQLPVLLAALVLPAGVSALLALPCIAIGLIFLHFAIENLHVVPKKRGKLWKPILRRLQSMRPASGLAKRERGLWGPLEIRAVDEEPALRENLWVFAVLGGSFALNAFALQTYESGALFFLFLPMWGVVFLLSGMIAIANPILVRRPGFFDLLLGTLLGPRDILVGAVSVNKPWLLRIYLVPCLFAGLWCIASPYGLFFLSVIGIGFGAFILFLGNVCALADPRAIYRIWPTLLIPLALLWAPALLPASLRTQSLMALTVLCLAAWSGVVALAWGEITPAKAGFRMAAVYLILVTLLVVLPSRLLEVGYTAPDAVDSNWDPAIANPWVVYSPWFWMLSLGTERTFLESSDWLLVAGYAVALAGTSLEAWWWTLRNFDRLVGRGMMPKSPQQPSLSAPRNNEVLLVNSL